jgi:type II secretory ATPase GspE/PulE/Tfp pilus assembly ATPase PilB-like protein
MSPAFAPSVASVPEPAPPAVSAAGARGSPHGLVLEGLVQAGALAPEDARRAAEAAMATSQPLGTVLDRLGLVSEIDWGQALAAAAGLPFLRIDAFPDGVAQPEGLSPEFLSARAIAPLEADGGTMRFAIADPFDRFVLKALRLAVAGELALAVAPPRDIDQALKRYREQWSGAQAALARVGGRDVQRDTDHLLELANEAPTVRFVEQIFAGALEKGATDIHIEPFERGAALRLRVDGVLIEQPTIALDLYAGVLSRLKILAALDIAERRLPQDGRLRQRVLGREFDVRVATLPSVKGETIALRILNHDNGRKSLDDLGMPAHVRDLFDKALQQRTGIVLVTGPTGSGKTTTLHAALSQLNDGRTKILTVENPVEIEVPGVVQMQSHAELGLDFAAALRTFLRHDPDVMMVGEIRDGETARVAIQAALTGHLVLSTLHTNDAASALTRLTDMGIEPFLVGATLRLAAAQRLVRLLCPHCREPDGDDETAHDLIAKTGLAGTPSLYRAKGCARCNQTGYLGRRALFEAVAPAPHGLNAGLRCAHPMLHHGLMLVADGTTSLQELFRVVDQPEAAP